MTSLVWGAGFPPALGPAARAVHAPPRGGMRLAEERGHGAQRTMAASVEAEKAAVERPCRSRCNRPELCESGQPNLQQACGALGENRLDISLGSSTSQVEWKTSRSASIGAPSR